ncbi:hypothetical protein [Streptomyces griseosporeus]|uniref:hypothetical protein n=1 Tax=Streptomyces griseosporeus TaxID=1910 RepID=UPI0036AF287A
MRQRRWGAGVCPEAGRAAPPAPPRPARAALPRPRRPARAAPSAPPHRRLIGLVPAP